MPTHEHFMQRCLQLAANGLRNVAPNPMVGCVVVHNGLIIGEGYHQQYGLPHAEVNALARVKDETLLPEATLYVSLEPCAHQGKTPPCANLIVAKGIKHVVIGCTDSYNRVNGKGIAILQHSGCRVEVGILEEECRELNKRFFTYHEKQRPYIILKWAQTQDGYLDKPRNGNTGINWISCEQSQRLAHQWRAEEQAILVGANTVINDNPTLTTRLVNGPSPTRIVLGNAPADAHVFNTDAPTLHYPEITLDDLMKELHTKEIQSAIIEGGAATLQSFIDIGLWDEARIIVGNVFFGEGLPAPKLAQVPMHTTRHFDDTLHIFRNQ